MTTGDELDMLCLLMMMKEGIHRDKSKTNKST